MYAAEHVSQPCSQCVNHAALCKRKRWQTGEAMRFPLLTRVAALQDVPGDLLALDLYVDRVLPQCRDISICHTDLVRLLSGQDGCALGLLISWFGPVPVGREAGTRCTRANLQLLSLLQRWECRSRQ